MKPVSAVSKLIVLIGGLAVPAVEAAEPAAAKKPVTVTAKQYRLRYHFRTNQVVAYDIVQKATSNYRKGDRRRTDRDKTTARRTYTVIGVDDDGSALLEPVVERVKMSLQTGQRIPRTYDSQRDKTPPDGFERVAKTVGKPLVRLKIEPNGRLAKSILLLSRRDQERLKKMAGRAKPANDAGINFLVVFPEKPVRVGESWSDRLLKPRLRITPGKHALFQEFPILRTYTLKSVAGDLATIEMTSASVRPANDVGLQLQMARLLPTATIVFDVRRGLIVSRESKIDQKVHGFAGSGSLLHFDSRRTEKLVPTRVASDEKSASTK